MPRSQAHKRHLAPTLCCVGSVTVAKACQLHASIISHDLSTVFVIKGNLPLKITLKPEHSCTHSFYKWPDQLRQRCFMARNITALLRSTSLFRRDSPNGFQCTWEGSDTRPSRKRPRPAKDSKLKVLRAGVWLQHNDPSICLQFAP